MAQPSPISTTPAFSSPALTRIFSPVVGNFFSSFFEFLYEQCSLHMTEKIPSSVKFGSRPRIFLIRSNSSGVRPCFAMRVGVIGGSTGCDGAKVDIAAGLKEQTSNVQRSTSNVQIEKNDAR